MFKNFEKREKEAELLFSNQTAQKLLKQEMSRWWDIKTLEKYLQVGRIPRGLRICIFPSFEEDDIESLKDWEELLINTSKEMIHKLIINAKKTHEHRNYRNHKN